MLDNYQDLIEELLGTPKALRDVFEGGPVTDEALSLLAELRDRDTVVLERLQRMSRDRTPHVYPLPNADALAATRAQPTEDAETLLRSFDSARGELISLLMNLTLRDWERTATEDLLGQISVADEVESHVEFDEAHLERITALGR